MPKTFHKSLQPSESASRRRGEQGQALVEYLLMLLVAFSVVGSLSFGFKRILLRIWGVYHKEISSPCPSCPPNNPSYRF
ncbi:MAG: hypothetical protein ACO3A2_00185 [Bdellovibrionia bacterium]